MIKNMYRMVPGVKVKLQKQKTGLVDDSHIKLSDRWVTVQSLHRVFRGTTIRNTGCLGAPPLEIQGV